MGFMWGVFKKVKGSFVEYLERYLVLEGVFGKCSDKSLGV